LKETTANEREIFSKSNHIYNVKLQATAMYKYEILIRKYAE